VIGRPCPEIKAATPLKPHHAVGHDHVDELEPVRMDVTPPLGLELQELIQRLARTQQIALKKSFSSDEVTPAHGLALNLIRDGCRIPKDVAAGLGYDPGATTRILDHLEEKGWVVRCRSNHDRRIVDLNLTHSGIYIANQCYMRLANLWRDWLSAWEVKETETLMQLLRRLDATLSESPVRRVGQKVPAA